MPINIEILAILIICLISLNACLFLDRSDNSKLNHFFHFFIDNLRFIIINNETGITTLKIDVLRCIKFPGRHHPSSVAIDANKYANSIDEVLYHCLSNQLIALTIIRVGIKQKNMPKHRAPSMMVGHIWSADIKLES